MENGHHQPADAPGVCIVSFISAGRQAEQKDRFLPLMVISRDSERRQLYDVIALQTSPSLFVVQRTGLTTLCDVLQ